MGHDSIYSRSNGRWTLEPRACHWLRYLRHRYAHAGCLNAGKAIVRTAHFGFGRASVEYSSNSAFGSFGSYN